MSQMMSPPPQQKESGGEIMLFGVRVKVDPMRKSVSMNNLSQYQHLASDSPPLKSVDDSSSAAGAGYASADDPAGLPHNHHSSTVRERKRGVPWTEEEHKLFLLGLQKVGKGDWRGISRNFVKTRTPTQVASHAQKYFLRKNNLNRRRRRSSLFDITTDSVTEMETEESKNHQDSSNQSVLPPSSLPVPELTSVSSNVTPYPVAPFPVNFSPVKRVDNASTMFLGQVPIVPIPTSSTMLDLNCQISPVEPAELSLQLSLVPEQERQSSTRHSAFFCNGENMISVA